MWSSLVTAGLSVSRPSPTVFAKASHAGVRACACVSEAVAQGISSTDARVATGSVRREKSGHKGLMSLTFLGPVTREWTELRVV